LKDSLHTLAMLFNSDCPSLKSVNARAVALFLLTNSPNLALSKLIS